ncbi:hypothetical protein SISSUDRAFT_1011154 [Sistotremastrum suecicum HHB10207 ss-3]|uniref:CRAL-TRIO domain-containing protein n=1 Tax=Sistotremastrum suecicum HHB10207 ss-3 TaxID=1314776 RepID=A0A165YI22_9AGAM|nr:hypothetical protein SISSUDRAFT_1011154 [Sistotremastrum suecicum HHB10207 ss-3]
MTSTQSPIVTDPNYKPLPGRIGNLTIPQQHTLEKFKKALEEEGWYDAERHDDATLLRFLRARKFDLEKALAMFIANEKWRKEFGVDEIVKSFDFKEKQEVDKFYPQYYHKMDKDGRPIYIERLGQLNVNELWKITTQDRLIKRLVLEYEKFLTERLPACSRAVGHPVETSCTILDLKGVGIKQFFDVKGSVQKASEIGQDRYPECMGKFYIINAPWGFSTVWSLVKGWLDPVTVAKISILGSSYQKDLLAQIPEENLPHDLGGKCRCAQGCSLSDAGPWNLPIEKQQGVSIGDAKEGQPTV